MQAARDNSTDVVKHWISISGDTCQLNERDSFGYAPLHYAAKFNRYDILVMLVEAGAGKHGQLHFKQI